ncbi:MAG: YgiT-type zinc finger protein [Phycisphaerales bacterium]
MCINCGSRALDRKRVSVRRRSGQSIEVVADVCKSCGERYYDLAAMRTLEE